MKQEDKNTILQFMGQVYGESKQNDQMLVNSSTNLQPKSDQIKDVFEKTLHANVQQNPQPNAPAPQIAEPVMRAPSDAPVQTGSPVHISVEQAAADLAQINQQPVPAPNPVTNITSVDEQLEFDLKESDKFDKLLDLIREQNNMISSIDSSIKLIVEKTDTTAKKYSAKNVKSIK